MLVATQILNPVHYLKPMFSSHAAAWAQIVPDVSALTSLGHKEQHAHKRKQSTGLVPPVQHTSAPNRAARERFTHAVTIWHPTNCTQCEAHALGGV